MTDLETLKSRFKLTPMKKTLDLSKQFLSAAFSPNGQFLLAGDMEGGVGRFTIVPEKAEPELTEMPTLTGLTAWTSTCVCLPDGKHVVAADSWGNLAAWSYCDDAAAPSWKVEKAHDGWIRSICVSPDGVLLASCGRDGHVRLWSAEGRKLGETTFGGDLYVVRFSPDGMSLFVGAFEGKVTQLELTIVGDKRSLTKLRDFDCSPLWKPNRLQDVGGVRALNVSADGATLLVGGTQPSVGGNVQGKPTVLVFDVATGTLKTKKELGADGDVFVTDIQAGSDGVWLISTSGNPGQGKFLVTRIEDEQPLFETKLSNTHAVRLHPSGKWLALLTTNAGSNGNGKVLDKDGNYRGNNSPLAVMLFPTT